MKAELPRRLLLQGRGDEGGGGIAPPLLLLDVVYTQGTGGALGPFPFRGPPRGAARRAQFGQPVPRPQSLLFGGDAELLDLLAFEPHQPRLELDVRALQIGLDGPVLALDEAFDLVLALDDHP